MIDTPQITQTAVQLAAIIHMTIPREEIRSVMGLGIGELMAAVAAKQKRSANARPTPRCRCFSIVNVRFIRVLLRSRDEPKTARATISLDPPGSDCKENRPNPASGPSLLALTIRRVMLALIG